MPRRRSPEAMASKALQQACELYAAIAETLIAIIARLRRDDAEAEPLSRAEIDVLKTHQKTVLMVLDFEAQILKRRLGDGAAGGRAIDLDAARREVSGRLARLDAASGTAGVP